MSATLYIFGDFRFLPSTRELWRGGKRVMLPRRTFECLEHLIAHRDRAVGRDELVDAVFGRSNVSDAQLGQIVLRARRAVDDDGNAQHTIRTIAGYGYRWIAPTEAVDESVSVQTGDARAPDSADDATREARPTTPTQTMRVARPRRSAIVALALLAILATCVAAIAWRSQRVGAPPADRADAHADSVAILPLQVDGLREDAWVRLGAMDLVAERLREAGLSVPPSENVLGLLSSSNGAADVDAAALRKAINARLVVRGRAVRSASGWKVELAALPAQGIAVPVEFAAHDAVEAARGATDLLLAALGRSLPPGAERDAALDETLQRARAAMLANELDVARSILGASPQLAAEPAQLAYRLAQVDLRAGRLDRAEDALDRVLALPQTQADARLAARVLNARGATRMRLGRFADGGTDFDAALALLGASGDSLERGQARLGRANSRVAEHRFDQALADFGSARVDLESAGDALGVARVDANLGMLELYRGRPAAALGYLPAAADRFQSFGALHELLITLTGLIDAQLAVLQRDEAAATLARAMALRERITDPDQRVDLLLNRAQVFNGAGRYREANDALAQARATATSGNRVLLARLGSLAADLAQRQQRWADADAAASAALADWPSSGADADRAAVVLTRQRALLALGRIDAARALQDRSRTAPENAADEPGQVDDALAMAEWSSHAGKTDQAEAWFHYAAASADRRAVPAEIVAVATAHAPRLLADGARDAAAAAIGRVAPWAAHDFDSALLQLRLFHALGQREAWFNALRQAQLLAGERVIPPELLIPRVSADVTAPTIGHQDD
jgi:DNA-binding winged helix-turn-helix (wHTH) protein/tetratricopeptide (TPR) repeat protein